MKIAFLNITSGLVERGAETYVLELSKRLKRDHQVEIVSGNKVPPKRWPILWRLFIDPNGLSVLCFTLKNLPKLFREKYEVIIPVDGGWEPALVRIVTWLYGGKMIVSGQSGKGWDDRNNLWCFPDAFVALSSRLKDWARCANPFVKVESIPNGVDLQKFNVQGPTLHVRLKPPVALCVGALTSEKRIDLVIKAVAKLENVSLLVVGDGEMKGEIEKLGKNLLNSRFQLVKMPFAKMPEVYRVASVFTIPSPWYRSFEIVLVEAMATNLPVVANDDPIRREIVGAAGILVNPQDTDKYAEAISSALQKKWGNKPRKQAEKFDWDGIAEKYNKLFKELING